MVPRTPQQMTAEVESVLGPAAVSYTQPEVVVLRFRRHGRRLVLPVLLMLAVSAAAGYWVGAFAEPWMNVLAAAGAIGVAVLLGLLPVLAWLTRRTTVTTRRIVMRRGLFVQQRSEVQLARVREVRARRNPVQRMWGSGDIDVLYGAEGLRIDDVPGVGHITDALQDLMERNYAQEARAQSAAFASAPQI